MYNFFFSCVAICFIVSLLPRKNIVQKDAQFTRFGLFCTVLADLFMVVLNRNTPAFIFFILAQLTYTRRFSSFKITAVTAACAVFIFLCAQFAPLAQTRRLALCYAACLCAAVCSSLVNHKKGKTRESLFAFLGMALFLLCDISVAVYNLAQNACLSNIFKYLIWVFYLPSQFFILISFKKTEQNKSFLRH